jgi:hypothetical protein
MAGLDELAGLHDVLRSLADGRFGALPATLDRLRAASPLLAEVAAADATARIGEVGLASLRALQERAARAAPDEPLAQWWALAILGERAFLDADLGVIPLAVQALPELPEEPFATLPLLYVRGRLRRIASAVYLVAPSPAAVDEHVRLRDLAIADFQRAGFTAEVALTRGLAAAIHAISTWDDVLEDLAVVADARAMLGDADDSVWLPVVDQLHALVALTAGELAVADAAIAGVERRREVHPVFASFADMARAEHTLVTAGGAETAVKAVTRALERLHDRHPPLLGLHHLRVANVLADYACTDDARAVGLAGLSWPPTNRAMGLAGSALRLRLDVLDGLDVSLDAVLHVLESLTELGLERRAGAMALRAARDFDRVGSSDLASSLRTWGLARLPAVQRRTAWEKRWSSPVDNLPPGDAAASRLEDPSPVAAAVSAPGADGAGVVVRVMVPVMEVSVDGEAVELRTMAAKLLLALLVAQPDPLHIEAAVDLLWPDADVDVGRRRLNTVVHRLRAALGLPPRTLRRLGDVLLLDVAGWDVDLFRLDVDQPLAGNLCHVQFPYDELFVERRQIIEARARRRFSE